MSRWRLTAHVLPLLLSLSATTLRAQERLIGRHTLGGGASFESISFGADGLRQSAFAGLDSVRVTSVQQFTLPITAITPLGRGWQLDVTALYGSGRVSYHQTGAAATELAATLAGMSDVRLRATGRFLSDAVTLTIGANAPTGRTSLSGPQFSALRVLAAPALGMGSAPVGAGPSGTLGVVSGGQTGPWAWAVGASYEYRGGFQPIAALIAGAPSSDFRPGAVVRASIGADRTLGSSRFRLAMAADVFTDDRLRGAADSTNARAVESSTLATVRLGPVLTSDVQLLVATTRFRELIAYASYLWRAPYARDGRTEVGSSGQYLAGGLRAALPIAIHRDLIVAGEGRWHSGLGIDHGLPTAGVRSASVTVGLDARRGLLSLQPYVRAQAGMLRQRGGSTPVPNQSFAGAAGGLVLITRF